MTQYDLLATAQIRPAAFNLVAYMQVMLLENEGQLYATVERYFLLPGVEDSPAYDELRVVDIFRKTEAEKGLLKPYTSKHLFRNIVKALNKLNFTVSRGKITGVYELLTEDDAATTAEANVQ